MAVKKEIKDISLKTTLTYTDEFGNAKNRNIYVRNINSNATDDNLLKLSHLVKNLFMHKWAAATKITDEGLSEIEG